MYSCHKNHQKSRPSVVPHFIEEGRQGSTRQSTSNLFLKKYVSYLYIVLFIYIYLKYLLRGRLFTSFWAFPRKNTEKRKRKGVLVDQSTSYEIFEHKYLFMRAITTISEGRLGSRTSVDLVDLQSFFENMQRRLKWS